jgi:hypothetical protein
MATPRNRTREPAEQRRAASRAAGRCVRCGEASDTWRCTACTREIEARTDRYRGRARRGAPSKIDASLVDLRYASESLLAGFAAVRDFAAAAASSPIAARDRERVLAEPMHQIDLARRFLARVLRDHRRALRDARRPTAPRRDPQLAFVFARGGA